MLRSVSLGWLQDEGQRTKGLPSRGLHCRDQSNGVLLNVSSEVGVWACTLQEVEQALQNQLDLLHRWSLKSSIKRTSGRSCTSATGGLLGKPIQFTHVQLEVQGAHNAEEGLVRLASKQLRDAIESLLVIRSKLDG